MDMPTVGLLLVAAVWLAFGAGVSLGQGTFLFNTRDPAADNNIRFSIAGQLVSDNQSFVEVLAGPDAEHLVALTPLLAVNSPGAEAGYANPSQWVFTVPGMTSGTASVGYRFFRGESWDTSSEKSATILGAFGTTPGPLKVGLVMPPDSPNALHLGSAIIVALPEPGAVWLLLLGMAAFGVRFLVQSFARMRLKRS